MARTHGIILVVVAAVTGCATSRPRPPPMQHFELGIARASYRDYASAEQSICTAEPRWLQDEISSVNGLLARWLDNTSAGYDGVWTPDQLDLLQQGIERLSPLLEVHERNLAALTRCRFGDERAFPDLVQRGHTYIELARKRIADGPSIMTYRTAKKALELWKREQPAREFQAKNRCPARVQPGSGQIYYAVENETGQTRWFFCDGARVVRANGGDPEVTLPTGLSKRDLRRVKPKSYLQAVQKYPPSNVDRAPTPPQPGPDSTVSDE